MTLGPCMRSTELNGMFCLLVQLIEALKAAGATYEFEHVAAPGAQHLFDQLDPSEEMEGMYAFLLKHL